MECILIGFYRNFLKTLMILWLVSGCNSEQNAIETSDLEWEPSTPFEEGIDPLVIDSIHQEIVEGKFGLIDHFLIIRNDKLIFDEHYNQDYNPIMQKYDTTNHQYNYDHVDWHPYYSNTNLHTLQSVTKSVTSILIGIALDEGLISNVESPMVSFFADFQPTIEDPIKKGITLQDLLTMQTGIEWDEANYEEATNSCILMEGSTDWINFVLTQPMDTIPGSVFNYNSGASVLLGKIIRTATGKSVDRWAEEKLFGPLGITDYYWKKTPKGEIDTEGGLYLSSHDLAKIGYLMLKQGKWEDKQIVSSKWVAASIYPSVTFNDKSGYGYQWWVPEHENGEVRIFAGNGFGGQFLMVAPEQNIIVVFNGWNIHEQPEKSSWRALQERILPGLL